MRYWLFLLVVAVLVHLSFQRVTYKSMLPLFFPARALILNITDKLSDFTDRLYLSSSSSSLTLMVDVVKATFRCRCSLRAAATFALKAPRLTSSMVNIGSSSLASLCLSSVSSLAKKSSKSMNISLWARTCLVCCRPFG